MKQEQTLGIGLMSRHALLLLLIALGISAAAVGFFLRGGWGLGLTLAIFSAEAGLWLFHAVDQSAMNRPITLDSAGQAKVVLPKADRSRNLFHFALTASILLLGSTYFVFRNEMLQGLNFLVIVYLFIVQSILLNRSSDRDWDEPLFWIESGLAGFVRPFASLGKLGWMFGRALDRQPSEPDAAQGDASRNAKTPIHLFGQIMLGLFLAVPVLLMTGSLLASADSVFSQYLSGVIDFWQNLSIQDRLIDFGLTLLFFPFVFSFLESCRSRWQLLPRRSDISQPIVDAAPGMPAQPALSHRERPLKLNPVTLITFLSCINLMYIVFAVVQAAYLTGAFRFILPSGISYAEYARKGFFELAGITPINVALIVLAVKGAGRQGWVGRILRGQSLLLIAGSLVQWLSAMFRMQMYISAYALTLMRFFVSAFMFLMLVIFILLIIKEFRVKFPLFKASAIAAVLALVVLNGINSDAIIARYNIAQIETSPARSFDLAYFRELSPDALPILLEALPQLDASRQQAVREHLTQSYQRLAGKTAGDAWQNLNWSQRRALNKLALFEAGQ